MITGRPRLQDELSVRTAASEVHEGPHHGGTPSGIEDPAAIASNFGAEVVSSRRTGARRRDRASSDTSQGERAFDAVPGKAKERVASFFEQDAKAASREGSRVDSRQGGRASGDPPHEVVTTFDGNRPQEVRGGIGDDLQDGSLEGAQIHDPARGRQRGGIHAPGPMKLESALGHGQRQSLRGAATRRCRQGDRGEIGPGGLGGGDGIRRVPPGKRLATFRRDGPGAAVSRRGLDVRDPGRQLQAASRRAVGTGNVGDGMEVAGGGRQEGDDPWKEASETHEAPPGASEGPRGTVPSATGAGGSSGLRGVLPVADGSDTGGIGER